jgi:hypothetical protein
MIPPAILWTLCSPLMPTDLAEVLIKSIILMQTHLQPSLSRVGAAIIKRNGADNILLTASPEDRTVSTVAATANPHIALSMKERICILFASYVKGFIKG